MNILELFSCSGGMAEGLLRAGLPVTTAIDFDPDACRSYAANMGHAPVRMDVRDLLRLDWRPREPIDLFVADPPCTPWSRAGKRKGLADEHDMLLETVALVRALRPRAFLIANVPGLDDGPNWPVVQRTIGSLSRDGYCIDFARLDAADYGVPQHRVRPFWYGHGSGDPHIVWPEPTHADPETLRTLSVPGVEPLRPWVTCRQALSHLPLEELGRPIRLRWRGQHGRNIASVPDDPARVVGTSSLSDGNVLAHPGDAQRRAHAPSRRPRASHMDAPAGTVTTEGCGNGKVLFDGEPPPRPARAHRQPGKGPRATHMDRPAGVVTTKDQGGDGCILFDGPDHRPTSMDEPAKTITRNTHSDGALLLLPRSASDRHPPCEPDLPARTVRPNGDHDASMLVVPHHPPSNEDEPSRTIRASTAGTPCKILALNGKHPPHDADAPANTIAGCDKQRAQVLNGNARHAPSDPDAPAHTLAAKDRGAQSGQAIGWPWDRPATTVTGDKSGRLAPPGHHDKSFLSDNRGHGPNAIKLSEKAAKILQGFPESWVFVGATKRARWQQLGMAMPPGLAHAVGRSIARALARVERAARG